jgi:CheY-like chemotaxis protein
MKNNLRIMLIDDNKIDLFIHRELIKKLVVAKELLQHTFASDALTYLKENKADKWPDIIVLDIYMPVVNGFEFLIEFEKLPKASRAKCKLILVSATLDYEDVKKARANPNVSAFIEKPVSSDKLKAIFTSL